MRAEMMEYFSNARQIDLDTGKDAQFDLRLR